MPTNEITRSVFVARQPIFDGQQNTLAYELLFRSGLENYCGDVDGDSATLDVIANTFLEIGMEELTAGKPCFINFTRKLLLDHVPQLLPPELIVVEILEDIEPDEEVVAACRELKDSGYCLAMDDFVLVDDGHPLLDVAQIVKVDFMGTSPEARAQIMAFLADKNIHGLAEKVETREEFEQALADGYSRFQGYFFAKPVIQQGKAVAANTMSYLRLLQEAFKPELSYEQLEETIKQDVALTYRLLRFINSAFFGLRSQVESIHHALVWLGPPEIRKWLALVSLREIASDKPCELMIQGLTRARMAEQLADHVGLAQRANDLFLMGMFSVLDALLDKPMEEAVASLPLDPEITSALLGRACRFRTVYDTILAFEHADWGAFSSYSVQLEIDEDAVQATFAGAAKWATDAMGLAAAA